MVGLLVTGTCLVRLCNGPLIRLIVSRKLSVNALTRYRLNVLFRIRLIVLLICRIFSSLWCLNNLRIGLRVNFVL